MIKLKKSKLVNSLFEREVIDGHFIKLKADIEN